MAKFLNVSWNLGYILIMIDTFTGNYSPILDFFNGAAGWMTNSPAVG
jgi:hypothetical protein